MSKIVFVNCTDIGSTGEVIWLNANYISDYGWKSILCSPDIHRQNSPMIELYKTSFRYEQGVYRRLSSIVNNIYGFAPISTKRIINKIKKEKPNIVHVHCANGNMVNLYSLLRFLREENVSTVITNHAEFYYTGYCTHSKKCDNWLRGCGKCPQIKKYSIDTTAKRWKKMKESLQGFNNLCVTSVSPWVFERSSKSPIMNNVKQVLIENGINTQIFTLSDKTNLVDETIMAFKHEKVILHVTAQFSNTAYDKGGAYVIELAKRFINSDVNFVIVGPYDFIPDVPSNMFFLDRISDKNRLAQIYNHADLCLVTSERETFGLSVAESLCCGTPVVGFKSGGSESVAIEAYSEFCDFGNVDRLEHCIRTKWLSYKNLKSKAEISDKAKERYNEIKMAKQYLELYEYMRIKHE